MAKPATEARLAAAANGFTQVLARGNSHIITKNPTTGKCAYDGQVGGGWHYGDGQETDTAFVPGTAPWNWQMVKANYNVFALSQFNQGQIIKWVDPGPGQYVTFQPMALQWTNNLNQIQQISMPQSVAAQVNDDILYWPAAYGSGRNFRYQACPDRLCKQLIIDSPSALPSTSYDTLELNFIISVSSGVNIMVNGAAWDKKSTKDTVNSIAFQLPGGAVLWSFAAPTAYDSSGTIEGSITGSMRLKKRGNSLYVSVRFPKSWIDAVPAHAWPIYIDPTVDYQVGASADDGDAYASGFGNSYWRMAYGVMYGMFLSSFFRFDGVTIPADATIDVAYVSLKHYNRDGTPTGNLYVEDDGDPDAITSYSDMNSREWSSDYVAITSYGDGQWHNSSDISALMQGLVDSYNYVSGAAVQFKIQGTGTVGTLNLEFIYTYDQSGNVSGPKLHIEYTEAASGNPFYAYAQQ